MRYLAAPVLALLMLTSCASSQIQRARQVDVDVHAAIAALDDAEMALCNPDAQKQCHSAIPAYTTAIHSQANAHILTMLKAGQALNDAVIAAPVAPAAKVNLATVSDEVRQLNDLLKPVLPAGSNLLKAVDTVTQDILALLPLFLK
jgi:hypothetical protein